MTLSMMLSRGARRSAVALTSLVLMSACSSRATPKDPPQAQTTRQTIAEVPRTPVRAAAPDRLADATPQNPLRPQPPRGEVVRQGPDRPAPDAVPQIDKLRVPPGFSISLYTDDVPYARSIALGPLGVAYVSTREDNRVYAVVDSDGDHRVDKVYTIAEGLDTPNGIAYRDGDLYVAEIGRILRYRNIDRRLGNPPKPAVVSDALPTEERHGWRYMRFGPDGWLYIPIGAPCDNCLRDNPLFASISRIRPDGTGLEVYASGVRNSLGIDWHPETGELWFTENGRDKLGDDIPPDELNRAPRPGLHFGYPHCHAGVILDPEFGEGHSCTEFVQPVQLLGPHVAALGMRFYTGAMFPRRYRNAAIIAEHGSWNRTEPIGYRVMAVPIENNEAMAYEPLVDGFRDPGTGDVWGRPVDVALLPDGSVLISDDWQGALYRLSYAGSTAD